MLDLNDDDKGMKNVCQYIFHQSSKRRIDYVDSLIFELI